MTDPVSVALILSSIAAFSLLGGIFICCLFLIFRTTDIKAMSEDISQVRFYINDWLEKDGSLQSTKEMTTYQSSDGKFEAKTLDELLEKMTSDPNSKIAAEDIEALQRIFEQVLKNDGLEENEFDDEDDEGDDYIENWKKE